MNEALWLLILGWGLGVFSSLIVGLFMFWLEGKRAHQLMRLEQRRDDIRVARNWATNGKKESLRGFDLSAANLSGKDLSGADLEEANFEGASMWGTNFQRANLRLAKFRKAKLVGVKMNQANLQLADFNRAILKKVDFSLSKLRQTKLANTEELVDCIWSSAQIDETTELPLSLKQELAEKGE